MRELSADNPARLKLALALHGIAAEEVDGCLEFLLDGDIWAAARVEAASPLRFLERDGADLISGMGVEIGVRRVPAADFASRTNARGIALGKIAALRGTYATVTLGGGCSLASAGRTCALCRGRELTENAGEVWPIDEVVQALRAAFEEGDAEFVHIVLGYFGGDDSGVRILIPYLDAIHRHFDTIVAITMHPPADRRAIDLTYASGVDTVCYSLEAPDEETMRAHFPGRANFIGYSRYLDDLRHATSVFPAGAIWSELMLDIGAPAAIEAAAARLAAMGVIPLFGVSASGTAAIDLAGAVSLTRAAFEAVSRAGISLNWIRDISSSFTPLDARHLVADAPQLPMLHQLGRSKLGAMTTRSLARMRRRLRVRRVRASFDSSQL
jgi:hypothetical protein